MAAPLQQEEQLVKFLEALTDKRMTDLAAAVLVLEPADITEDWKVTKGQREPLVKFVTRVVKRGPSLAVFMPLLADMLVSFTAAAFTALLREVAVMFSRAGHTAGGGGGGNATPAGGGEGPATVESLHAAIKKIQESVEVVVTSNAGLVKDVAALTRRLEAQEDKDDEVRGRERTRMEEVTAAGGGVREEHPEDAKLEKSIDHLMKNVINPRHDIDVEASSLDVQIARLTASNEQRLFFEQYDIDTAEITGHALRLRVIEIRRTFLRMFEDLTQPPQRSAITALYREVLLMQLRGPLNQAPIAKALEELWARRERGGYGIGVHLVQEDVKNIGKTAAVVSKAATAAGKK